MLFNIYHKYDIDGGFGDAITAEDYLGYIECDSEKEAQEYCYRFSCTFVYDIPYNSLTEGTLIYKKAGDKPLDMDKTPIPEILKESKKKKYKKLQPSIIFKPYERGED